METIFKEWRGKLGWVFSAEDCAYEARICQEAKEWFEREYGTGRKEEKKDKFHVPEEMCRKVAERHYRIKKMAITYGIKHGYLPYHKKEGTKAFFFYVTDLENFRAIMENEGRWKKWKR